MLKHDLYTYQPIYKQTANLSFDLLRQDIPFVWNNQRKSTSNYYGDPNYNRVIKCEDMSISLSSSLAVKPKEEAPILLPLFRFMEKKMGKELLFMVNLYEGNDQFMRWHFDHAEFMIVSFGDSGTFQFLHNEFCQDECGAQDQIHSITLEDRHLLHVSKETDRTYSHRVVKSTSEGYKRISVVGFDTYTEARVDTIFTPRTTTPNLLL